MEHKFSRNLRLTSDEQFKCLFKKGNKIKTKLCAVFFCYNDLTYSRLGLVVPKKSIKKATERNRFKRIARECFRLRKHKLEPMDILFLAYKEAEGVIKKNLCQHLEKQLDCLALQRKEK